MLEDVATTERPTGVTVIAILLLSVAAYLGIISGLMLTLPGTVSMSAGAPLLGGLELAGPFMFLLMAAVAVLIGWGLLRMNNWARRIAIAAALAGCVLLIPSVSAAAIDLRLSLVWGGLGIMVRVIVVWYLLQAPVVEQFSK
jgi:hypothetical protein